MAIKTYVSAGVYDDHLGGTTLGGSSTSITTAGVSSAGFTAPNLVNKATGVWLGITTIPYSGNFLVELMQGGVSRASATINLADMVTGYNYCRFTTPYTFATLTASAYTIKVSNTVSNSGTLRSATSSFLFQCTYDTATTLGATDDLWVGGFHNAGLTTKTLTATGTSMSFGSGADTSIPTTWSTGYGLMIGNGGTFKYDTSASTTVQVKGSIGVYTGGLFDMRPDSSDITKVSTLVFDNVSDGNFALIIVGGGLGGQALTTGKTVSVTASYASGTGTAADPVITSSAHGFTVNDEVIFGGATDYLKNELRYVKSIPSSTQLVLSTTIGGAEAALVQSHSVGSKIGNMTRNSVIKNTNTAFGFSISQTSSIQTPATDLSYTRAEYPNCLSGRNLQIGPSIGGVSTNIDGFVVYNNSAQGRTSLSVSGNTTQTISNIILYNTRGTNYSAQSGLAFTAASNKTLNGLYHYANPSSTTNCAALSISNTSTNIAVKNLYSYGANAANGGAGYAIGIFGSGNTLDNINVEAARRQAIILDAGQLNEFTIVTMGVVGNNTIDIFCNSSVLAQANFLTGTYGSTTLISNYLNTLSGSNIGFQDMDGNTSKHRWYTNNASFWSAGSGLPDTTVRTAGSLSLALKPEDATNGTKSFIIKTPAPPTSRVGVYGYIYRNATFSSGDIVVDFFLPGTLETSTPDATYTMPTTTGQWMLFSVGAYNPSTVARYAKVRITAKTATAGAYCFLDDLYDAGTNNKVAGLDLWDNGHISPIMVVTDFSSAVPVLSNAVWSDSTTYTSGQKGDTLKSAADNAELAAIT